MPYIDPVLKRPEIDDEIDALIRAIYKLGNGPEADGNINYSITKMMLSFYGYREGLDIDTRYFLIARAAGVLDNVRHEFYREVHDPYEDQKKRENGEVQPLKGHKLK